MGQTLSPLRYPGGKTRLSNFVEHIIIKNGLLGGHYAEPYAGGAGIAWKLLFNKYVSHVYINDINRSVHAFWWSVLNQPDELCRLIQDTKVSIEEWHRQKKVQADPNADPLSLGFSTFFLNRTNRSGIVWAGVIGGKKQDGLYKLDARFNKKNLVPRIQKIAGYKEMISLSNLDALVFIKSQIPLLPEKTLIYFDPPYYKKGAGLYENHYQHDDHQKVAIAVSDVSHKWIVSYDNVPEISDMYSVYPKITYDLTYSAADRYSGSEAMFFSPGLLIPDGGPITNLVQCKVSQSNQTLQTARLLLE